VLLNSSGNFCSLIHGGQYCGFSGFRKKHLISNNSCTTPLRESQIGLLRHARPSSVPAGPLSSFRARIGLLWKIDGIPRGPGAQRGLRKGSWSPVSSKLGAAKFSRLPHHLWIELKKSTSWGSGRWGIWGLRMWKFEDWEFDVLEDWGFEHLRIPSQIASKSCCV